MVLLKGEQWRRRTMGTTTSIQKFKFVRGCRCHACCRYTSIVFLFLFFFLHHASTPRAFPRSLSRCALSPPTSCFRVRV